MKKGEKLFIMEGYWGLLPKEWIDQNEIANKLGKTG